MNARGRRLVLREWWGSDVQQVDRPLCPRPSARADRGGRPPRRPARQRPPPTPVSARKRRRHRPRRASPRPWSGVATPWPASSRAAATPGLTSTSSPMASSTRRRASPPGRRGQGCPATPRLLAGKVNTTDPDSRPIPIGFGFVQGYNAQAAVSEQQIVLAAETTNTSTDFSQLDPMVTATLDELERAGIDQPPETVAADAGYWNEQHMDEVVANKHIPVLVAPDKGTRGTPKRWLSPGRASWMRSVLGSQHGQAVSKTQTDGRAVVRQHQAQQRRLPVPPTRQNGGAPRVAIADDDPQPHQASPPPARRRGGLNRPHTATAPPTTNTVTAAHSAPAPSPRAADTFERQPPSRARDHVATAATSPERLPARFALATPAWKQVLR
jgi:hypothetical protein